MKRGYLAGGGTIVGETYTPFNRTQDYGPYISQARSANPGAVFAVYFAAEALTFVKQYDSFGMKANIPLFGPIGFTPPVLRKAQGKAALGVISPSNYVVELDTPVNHAFREAYRKKYNEDPEEFSVMGYDAMRFIFEAVKARGGDTKDRPALVIGDREGCLYGAARPDEDGEEPPGHHERLHRQDGGKRRQCRLRSASTLFRISRTR